MALIYRGSYLYNDIRSQKVNYCDISRQKNFNKVPQPDKKEI